MSTTIVTIADLIDQYESGAKLRGLAPTQMNALKPVRRGLGILVPAALRPNIIVCYVDERRVGMWSGAHGARMAKDATIRRELGALSAVLNWAHQRNLLKDAPPKIDLPPASPPREVFLTKAEADVLWARAADKALTGNNVGLFACLALDTWARAGAIERLTWDRVAAAQIDYREPGRPETAKRRVPVPLSTRLRTVLAAREPHRVPGQPAPLVTGPVTQYAWGEFKQAAGVRPDLTRHDLRRTGISLAVGRGVDLLKVAQMAGDNYDTILKHYARFAPDYLEGVVT